MWSQIVSAFLQPNYFFLSLLPHAGFRNKVGGRKIAHKRKKDEKRKKEKRIGK